VLVQLVARAVRLGVVEERVVVTVLVSADEDEAVECCIRALAGHVAVQIVARELRADRRGVRDERGITAELDLHRRDVVRVERFLLEFAVIDVRALADHDFGDGVREVHARAVVTVGADVAFDDRRLDVVLCNNEHARVRDRQVRALGRDEQQMDRLFDDRPAGKVQERAIAEKAGVQRDERVLLDVRELGEVLLEDIALFLDRVRQPADLLRHVGAWRSATDPGRSGR
jgi:hypothetical protein